MTAALSIWWDGKIVGRLMLDAHGDMGFVCDAAWLADADTRALSRSLPKREKPFDRRETRPFFAGLLPEESIRENVARALGKLLDAAIFNLIAGNADAHGKNFSLLYAPDGTRLAPLYDLMCTAAYPELATRPAMKIADVIEPEDFSTRTWDKFAGDIQLGAPFLRRRVREIANAVEANAGKIAGGIAAEGFDRAALDRYAAIVLSRAKTIAAPV